MEANDEMIQLEPSQATNHGMTFDITWGEKYPFILSSLENWNENLEGKGIWGRVKLL